LLFVKTIPSNQFQHEQHARRVAVCLVCVSILMCSGYVTFNAILLYTSRHYKRSQCIVFPAVLHSVTTY